MSRPRPKRPLIPALLALIAILAAVPTHLGAQDNREKITVSFTATFIKGASWLGEPGGSITVHTLTLTPQNPSGEVEIPAGTTITVTPAFAAPENSEFGSQYTDTIALRAEGTCGLTFTHSQSGDNPCPIEGCNGLQLVFNRHASDPPVPLNSTFTVTRATTEGSSNGSGSGGGIDTAPCRPCGTSGSGPSTPGQPSPVKHSIHLDLGSFSTGSPSAGTIDLVQPITNVNALTPASFQINANMGWPQSGTQLSQITTAEERQILTPLSFIRLIQTAPGIVRIDFHPATDAQPPASGQTLHTTNAAPHTSHIYQKLTREGFTSGLQHTTIANGKTTVESFFAITQATGTHTLHIAPDGTHTDTQETVTSSIPAGRAIETNRYLLDGTTQLPISRTVEAYTVKPWGKEALVSTTNGIAPNAQTTTHAYYESDQLPGYKEKRQTIHPDGSWTTWLYSTTLDGKSYLSHTLTPWLDAPAPLATATVAEAVANSRATHHDETGAITHETILGSTVLTRETTGTTNGETTTTTPASGNSVTTATLYHNPPFNALPGTKGPLALTVSEDLSATYYNQAEIGTFDTTTQAFSLLPGGLDTRNTTTTGRVTSIGLIFNTVPGQSTRTTNITRKGLGTIRRTLDVLIGTTWQPATVTTYTYDAQGNLATTTTNGDITTHPAPGDPNATVQTDTSDTGEVTITTTDATTGETLSIVRQGTATQAHIVTTFATTRAANGNQTRVTTTFAATGPDANGIYTPIANTTTTSSVTTDLLGRTLSSTDELGTLTTYTYPDPLTTTQTRNGVTVTTTRHLDGQPKTTSGTGTIPEHHTYAVANGLIEQTTYHGSSNATSPRWTKTTTDGLGRTISTQRPGYAGAALTTAHLYDTLGRLVKTTSTGQPAQFIEYDATTGQPHRQGLDLNNNGTLDTGNATTASPDRLTQTTSAFILDEDDVPHRQTITTAYATGDGTGTLTTTTLSPLYQSPGTSTASTTTSDQTQSSSTATTIDKPNKTVTTTQTTTTGDTTLTTTSITVNGLLISSGQVKQGETVLIAPTTYTHDDLGRVTGITDPRTGAITTRTYNAVGQLLTVTSPLPLGEGQGEGAQHTYTYYAANHVNAGQLASVTDPLGRTTYTAYDTLGRTTAQWGATYPVSYAYNIWGQMTHLKTWRTNAPAGATADPATHAGGDLTTWTYEPATGLLLNKTHADGKGPAYTYTPSGQLLTREWARGIETTYTHDLTGNLTGIDYDDTTPDITHTYDRLGRRLTTTDAAGTRTYAYNTTTGAQSSETYSVGLLNGLTHTATYQNGQRTAYQVTLSPLPLGDGQGEGVQPTELHQSAATYNALGQMATTTSGGLTATYNRHSDGTISGQTIKNAAAATLLQNTLTHDTANRLTKTEWKNGANTVLSSHTYTLDAANQRTKATQADNSAWNYTYDTYGQVTSANKTNPAAQPYPGTEHTYTYDHIGNRTQSGIGVPPVVLKEYTANALNQYTAVANPGSLFVLGSAAPDTTVTVNNSATQRLGNWFAGTATADTTNGPVWLPVETKAVKPTGGQNNGPITKTQNGHLFLPPQTETPTYDDDGNLTSDGRWTITWNGENRMIAQETNPAAVAAGVPKQRLEHTYDSEGRRIRLVLQTWNATTGTWTTATDTRYAYDAYNEVANWTVAPATSAILQTQSLHWGLDLSQTEQGAGGVGGLIAIHTSSSKLLPCYDGNGNITAYIDATTQKPVALYDYDAFGNQIQLLPSTSPLPTSYGFSTKPTDPITNWSYYTFRHYDPVKGRWTNRDIFGEFEGNENPFCMLHNSAIYHADKAGLFQWDSAKAVSLMFQIINSDIANGVVGSNSGPGTQGSYPKDTNGKNLTWGCVTDCSTFVTRVFAATIQSLERPNETTPNFDVPYSKKWIPDARKVLGIANGLGLGHYLMKNYNWGAVFYWNDTCAVKHIPEKINDAHNTVLKVRNKGVYHDSHTGDIQISGSIIGISPWGNDSSNLQTTGIIRNFSNVKFAVASTFHARHTFIITNNIVVEAHIGSADPNGVYDRTVKFHHWVKNKKLESPSFVFGVIFMPSEDISEQMRDDFRKFREAKTEITKLK